MNSVHCILEPLTTGSRSIANLTADRGAVDTLVRLHDGQPVTDSLTIAREFGRRHDNVMASLRALISDGTISALEFKERDYRDSRGKIQTCIELKEEGALIAMPFIGGKKSRDGQKTLVRAFLAMRDQFRAGHLPRAPSPPVQSPVTPTGDLALAESVARMMNVSPSGRIALLRQVAENHGLDTRLLPAYVVDAPADALAGSEPTAPISKLLKDSGGAISAIVFNRVLEKAGLLSKRTRKTSQQCFPGGIKSYWCITPAGAQFGKNLTDPKSPRETQPHWYVSRFDELCVILRPIYRQLRQEGALRSPQ